MVWKAVDVAQPGDVLVIATYRFSTASTFGENVVKAAKLKGLAGIVSDGMCRDAAAFEPRACQPLPRVACPRVPASGPGEIGGAISCGGVAVHSGDVVVGDEDGVVIVPIGDLPVVGERLKAIAAKEAKMESDINAGMTMPAWVDAVLSERGCDIVDLQHRK